MRRYIIPLIFLSAILFSANILFAEDLKDRFPVLKKLAAGRQNEQEIFDQLFLPERWGYVEQKYRGTKGRVVVCLSSIVGRIAAERNAALIIDLLYKNFGVSRIYTDGEGDPNTALFASFPMENIRQALFDYYLEAGEIIAPEYVAISKAYPLAIGGAGERSGRGELEAFRVRFLKNGPEIKKRIDNIRQRLLTIRSGMYSAELLEFVAREESLRHSPFYVNRYVEYLFETAHRYGISTAFYHQFHEILHLTVLEQEIDFTRVKGELDSFLKAFDQVGGAAPRERFIANTAAYRMGHISPDAYFRYLARERPQLSIFSEAYPNLSMFLRYVDMYERLAGREFATEMKHFARAIKAKLFRRADEFVLDELITDLALLENIFNLSIGEAEGNFLNSLAPSYTTKDFDDFISAHAKHLGIMDFGPARLSDFDAQLFEAKTFYRLARDYVTQLTERMLLYMSERGENAAIIVIDRRYADAVREILVKHDVSHLVVHPRLSFPRRSADRRGDDTKEWYGSEKLGDRFFEEFSYLSEFSLQNRRPAQSLIWPVEADYKEALRRLEKEGLNPENADDDLAAASWTVCALSYLEVLGYAYGRDSHTYKMRMDAGLEAYRNLLEKSRLERTPIPEDILSRRREEYMKLSSFLLPMSLPLGESESRFHRIDSKDAVLLQGAKLGSRFCVFMAGCKIPMAREKRNRITDHFKIFDEPENNLFEEVVLKELNVSGSSAALEDVHVGLFLVNKKTYEDLTGMKDVPSSESA